MKKIVRRFFIKTIGINSIADWIRLNYTIAIFELLFYIIAVTFILSIAWTLI